MKLNYLWLSDELAGQIVAHARAGVPKEVCGLIAGHEGRADKIIPIKNMAADPVHFYEMDQAALSRHLPTLSHEGLDLIGFYHSHPSGEPIPSPVDVARSDYPGTAYLIVGLKGNEPRLAAWLIEYRRVIRLPLHVGTLPPKNLSGSDQVLSDAQKTAAVISAWLAFVLLIVLALILLPPAPVIP
ncbi:MAG TPA: M67 family metallopeptidase [Phototrophicaceae bacterium]|nr:M67 family metallopeptidase [Phototrophicaceae bacterium]